MFPVVCSWQESDPWGSVLTVLRVICVTIEQSYNRGDLRNHRGLLEALFDHGRSARAASTCCLARARRCAKNPCSRAADSGAMTSDTTCAW